MLVGDVRFLLASLLPFGLSLGFSRMGLFVRIENNKAIVTRNVKHMKARAARGCGSPCACSCRPPSWQRQVQRWRCSRTQKKGSFAGRRRYLLYFFRSSAASARTSESGPSCCCCSSRVTGRRSPFPAPALCHYHIALPLLLPCHRRPDGWNVEGGDGRTALGCLTKEYVVIFGNELPKYRIM